MATSVIRVIVHGTVQGVGFRYFARRRAELLGLSGTVRNLPDRHTVEVVAHGPQEALDAYLEDLRHGPTGSHVTSLDVEELPGAPPMSGFTILP